MLMRNAGFSLLEVLITLFIVAIGVLGLAGLQGRALMAEIEAMSRGQAQLLVNDLAERINANNANIASYNQSGVTFGTGHTNACVSANPNNLAAQATCCRLTTEGGTQASIAARDLCEWDLALQGIGTANSAGSSKLGGLVGARGCVTLTGTARVYQIDVVWQGRDSTGAVASDVSCGNTAITTHRRAVTRRLRDADLSAS